MSTPMALDQTVEEWRAAALDAIADAAALGQPFTTEDLEEWVGAPPNRNGWQGVLNTRVARRLVRSTGVAQSRKPSRNRAWVLVYSGIPDEREGGR